MYPDDVDPMSGCRLPVPRREDLDVAGQLTYDDLADPEGETIKGLRGPGGIMLQKNPKLAQMRCDQVIDARRELHLRQMAAAGEHDETSVR